MVGGAGADSTWGAGKHAWQTTEPFTETTQHTQFTPRDTGYDPSRYASRANEKERKWSDEPGTKCPQVRSTEDRVSL